MMKLPSLVVQAARLQHVASMIVERSAAIERHFDSIQKLERGNSAVVKGVRTGALPWLHYYPSFYCWGPVGRAGSLVPAGELEGVGMW